MAGMGYAVMGTATAPASIARSKPRRRAIASPLLEAGAIDGARGILINITGSSSLKLAEVQQACTIIQGAAHEDANIIFGAVLDEKMKDEVKITVIATGFREVPTGKRRTEEVRTSFSASHNDRMERYPEPAAAPSPRFEPDDPAPDMIMLDDHASAPSCEPEPMMPPPSMQSASAEVVSYESAPNPVVASYDQPRTFEANDLDVPAFLRKGRGDIM